MKCTLQNYTYKPLSIFLVFLFVVTPIFQTPQKAFAVDAVTVVGGTGTVPDIKTSVESTVSAVANSLSAATLKTLGIKEWALDAVAWALAKKVVMEMARSTVSWVNSGFQGSPMFVTDPGAFLLDIADETAGQIIYGSDLDFLCSPINVRVALDAYYRSLRNKNPLRCTLTSAVGNVQNFVDGNFGSGGWPAWLQTSLNPTNSNLGSAFAGQAALLASIQTKQGQKTLKWNWGRGFLDKEECTGTGAAKVCKTVTPGETISNALSFELSTGERALIEADEINEIIGALAGGLISQGIKGVFSLAQPGSGSSGYGSGSSFVSYNSNPATSGCAALSYIDQMNTPACNPLENSANPTDTSGSLTGSGAIFEAENDELSYQAMQQRIVRASDAIIFEAQRRGDGCSINDDVTKDATTTRANAITAINASEGRVLDLAAIRAKYDGGTEQEKLTTLTQFADIVNSGTLRTSTTNARDLHDVDEAVTAIQGWSSRIEDCPNTSTNTHNTSTDNDGGT